MALRSPLAQHYLQFSFSFIRDARIDTRQTVFRLPSAQKDERFNYEWNTVRKNGAQRGREERNERRSSAILVDSEKM